MGQTVKGQPNGLATLDADGKVPTSQLPAAASGVASVNGQAGAVVLDAADVGADPAGTAASAVDALGAVQGDSTAASNPAAPLIEHVRDFAVTSSDTDIVSFWTQALKTAWQNEWGGYRGRSPASYTDDAVFRAIYAASYTGNLIEIRNVAGDTTPWAVDAAGTTKRFGVGMADVLVLGAADAVPAGTPAGTVILRTS